MKPLIQSLSGTRGIIGENFSPDVALEIGMAFGTFTKEGTVIVGGDTRTSHDMIKSAVMSGLLSVGINVIDIGRVPTPTVQQMIKYHKAQAGIVVTASHNPIIWNGLKLMNSTGSFLDDVEYDAYTSIAKNKTFNLKTWDKVGQLSVDTKALEKHVDIIMNAIDTRPIQGSTLKVLIDPNNGAGATANPVLFKKLGIECTMINEKPNGHFAHNPEPLKENLDAMITELKKGKYDIGFVQDADADRLVILDENGRFIGEDYSLAFCMDYVLANTNGSNKKVVVNLSTSNVINWLSDQYNAKVTQTKIGETNVTQELKAQNATVGGEGNGGIIYPKVGWGRDSLTGIVLALLHLTQKKKKVSEIVEHYPTFVMLRKKVEVENKDQVDECLTNIKNLFKDNEQNTLDGVKVILDNAWVHVRPSNTEPIIRIFIEAPSIEKAEVLFEKIVKNKCLEPQLAQI